MNAPTTAAGAVDFDVLARRVEIDPVTALVDALAVAAAVEPVEAGRALRLAGLAALRLGDPAAALEHLDRAVALVAGTRHEGETEMSRVGPLAELGRRSQALAAADRSVELTTGPARARAMTQRATLRFRLHGDPEALTEMARAEQVLRRAGDDAWLARLRWNRAFVRASLHDIGGAERDLEAAMDHHRRREAWDAVRGGYIELGELASRRGDLVAALRRFEEADAVPGEPGGAAGLFERHRCDVLLNAQLTADAVESARRAVDLLAGAGMELARSEALIGLAQALMTEGAANGGRQALDDARRVATEAIGALEGRQGWEELARFLACEAAAMLGEGFDAGEAVALADAVEANGLVQEGRAARLRAVEMALLGARPMPDEIVTRAARSRPGRPDLEVLAAHVRALAHLRAGRVGAASRALTAGFHTFTRHQASLGATETRVRAGRSVQRLAATGLGLALAGGRPSEVLKWMERGRAGALRFPPVQPIDDRRLVADLEELHALEARAADPEIGERMRGLQESIRRRSLVAEGAPVDGGDVPTAADLVTALGDATYLGFEVHEGRVVGVLIGSQDRRVFDAGPLPEVSRALDGVRFGLQRLARGSLSLASREAAFDMTTAAAGELSERLLGPVPRSGTRLVVCPTGPLHAVPWSALPGIGSRPVTVTPSADLWMRRNDPAPAGGRVVLVAGPDLEHADAEVHRLARHHRRPRLVPAAEASVATVAAALSEARLAHLACHGRFRADNPLFSSLRLADGGLSVYDLERLPKVPSVIILSACDAGLSSTHPGNELMGLVAGLLSMGTRVVVASVGLFPDAEETVELMDRFHDRLAAGSTPAEALRSAAWEVPGVAGVSLVCFGAG